MKLLPDSNALIALFRDPARREAFDARMGRPFLLISSVVAFELAAGCRKAQQRKALASFLKPFEKANRILTPGYSAWQEAGRVLAAIADEGIGLQHRRQLICDTLIAVTAARSGAVVVTSNAADFKLLSRHVPVRWIPY